MNCVSQATKTKVIVSHSLYTFTLIPILIILTHDDIYAVVFQVLIGKEK